jgi:hypothetical protein
MTSERKSAVAALLAAMMLASPAMAAAQSQTKTTIHDPATAKDPMARGHAVSMLLNQYRHGWLWSLGRH